MHGADESELVPPLVVGSPGRRLGWSIALIVGFGFAQVVVGIVAGFVFGIVATLRGMSPSDTVAMISDNPQGVLVLFAVIEAVLLLGALFCATGFGFRAVGLQWDGATRSLMMLAPLVAVLVAIFWSDPTVSLNAALTSNVLGTVLILACLIGLFEELVFRGFLVGILGGVTAPAVAVGLSSMLFAAPHVFAPDGTLQQHPLLAAVTVGGLFGVPFALVYLRTGSILGLAIVHAAWDALVIGARGLEQPTNLQVAAIDWLLPAVVAMGYAAWYVLTSGSTVQLRRPPRSDVDWDAIAMDADNPLILAQIRRAAGQQA